ncbi:response regulator [Candidatus Woesearchaeota archaeon]|nr:response regulator [Candidatus Woesearchaeota archaeon]
MSDKYSFEQQIKHTDVGIVRAAVSSRFNNDLANVMGNIELLINDLERDPLRKKHCTELDSEKTGWISPLKAELNDVQTELSDLARNSPDDFVYALRHAGQRLFPSIDAASKEYKSNHTYLEGSEFLGYKDKITQVLYRMRGNAMSMMVGRLTPDIQDEIAVQRSGYREPGSKKETEIKESYTPIIGVVDDEEAIRTIVGRILSTSKDKYDVRSASSGQEAIESGMHECHLIYMDKNMPGMNGYETASALKQANPDLKIILLTGYSTDEDERLARGAGISQVVSKPIGREKLINLTQQYLRD